MYSGCEEKHLPSLGNEKDGTLDTRPDFFSPKKSGKPTVLVIEATARNGRHFMLTK